MAAIITQNFRRGVASHIFNEILAGSIPYYVGIGKSDPWSATEDVSSYSPPLPSDSDAYETRLNLQSLVKIQPSDVRYVIPRVTFKSGYAYKSYNTYDSNRFFASAVGLTTTFPCYAINDGKIYVCMRAGAGVALNAPTENSYAPAGSADGYVWVRVASLELDSPFNTDQFVAVVPNDGIIVDDTIDTAGMVFSFAVLDGGSGYSSATKPTVKLVGKGMADVDLEVTVNVAGQITKIDFPAGAVSSLAFPTGYTEASVVYSGVYPGSGAVVAPVIAPLLGFGNDPNSTLPTWFLGIPTSIAAEQGGDAYIIPYRQISIVKSPERAGTETPAETPGSEVSSIDALKFFVVPESSIVAFSPGAIITQVGGSGTTPKAFFDTFKRVEISTGVFQGRIYYHQNNSPNVNLKDFAASGTISISGGGSPVTYTFSSKSDPEFVSGSGEILFIENRKAITRNSLQTEELKIVIQC